RSEEPAFGRIRETADSSRQKAGARNDNPLGQRHRNVPQLMILVEIKDVNIGDNEEAWPNVSPAGWPRAAKSFPSHLRTSSRWNVTRITAVNCRPTENCCILDKESPEE
ncbi:MAG: hypothetical protein ACE14L_15460, partial [Terriglobales bacterium]